MTTKKLISNRSFLLLYAGVFFVAYHCNFVAAQQRTSPEEFSQYFPKRLPTGNPSFIGEGKAVQAKPLLNFPKQTAQSFPEPQYKTSGTEFYVVFLSAIGDGQGTQSPKRVYISSRSHSRGKISRVGGGYEQRFELTPHVLTPITLPPWAMLDPLETEFAYSKLFTIETEDECAVYAVSLNQLSSDGCLVLPRQSLGMKYVVASLRNALYYYRGVIRPSYTNANVPRSEFAVAAIENNTTVTIQLAADSYSQKYRKGIPYQFTLNRGEVLPFAARDTGIKGTIQIWDAGQQKYNDIPAWVGSSAAEDCDLTGSIITSDQPVVVYSGHERASAPDDLEHAYPNHPNVSRDHLVEQMPPVELWGKEFIVMGSMQDSKNGRPSGGDIIRVLTYTDNNLCYVNGVLKYTLKQGAYSQFYSNELAHIKTSEPALVVKYMQTTENVIDSLGDPDMTIVPPIENMSTEYTIPTIAQGSSFSEHYISILIDSNARSTARLNKQTVNDGTLTPVPNTRFLYGRYRTYAGEHRLESPLPCYAETYGYGPYDSYSLSGGGSFLYQSSLRAKDLDLGFIQENTSKDSLTYISGDDTLTIKDTITLFRITWESGDTNVFGMLDTITGNPKLAPDKNYPLRFSFSPPRIGKFQARIRVWSSNETPIYITLTGAAGNKGIRLSPTVLDFGKVRVGKTVTKKFALHSLGILPVTLLQTNWQTQLQSGMYTPTATPTNPTIPDSFATTISFTPSARSSYSDSISFFNDALPVSTPKLVMLGQGVKPHLNRVDTNLGEFRFSKPYEFFIPIINLGDDTTSVHSVRIFAGNTAEFYFADSLSLPTPATQQFLDVYESVTIDTPITPTDRFFVKMGAKLIPHDKGFADKSLRSVVIEVRSTDSTYYYSAAVTGVEPWFASDPPALDFGVFVDPIAPVMASLSYRINNKQGTGDGYLYGFQNFDSHFTPPDTIVKDSALFDVTNVSNLLTVKFATSEPGEFFDSVLNINDGRNIVYTYIHAVVRASLRYTPLFDFGDFGDCTPLDTAMVFTNPTSVNIRIDSLFLAGQTGGFEITDPTPLVFPIIIKSFETFTLRMKYRYPSDSVNGSQEAFLILRQPLGGEAIGFRYDTVRFTLYRKFTQLSLASSPPPFKPNALDEPFRIPIYINGDRLGQPDLDNITIRLQFNNDLLQPIGVDRSGSLSEESVVNGIPGQPPGVWDEATRTFSVRSTDIKLSSNSTKNTLLFTVLAEAYLTTDSVVTMYEYLDYIGDQPCGLRVLSDSLVIDYADECGDGTIRSMLLRQRPTIVFLAPYPDPAVLGEGTGITIPFEAAAELDLAWKLYDESGAVVVSREEKRFSVGRNTVTIERNSLTSSGVYILKAEVRDSGGRVSSIHTKFSVMK